MKLMLAVAAGGALPAIAFDALMAYQRTAARQKAIEQPNRTWLSQDASTKVHNNGLLLPGRIEPIQNAPSLKLLIERKKRPAGYDGVLDDRQNRHTPLICRF